MDTAAGKDTLYINGSQIAQRSIGSGGSYASQVGYPLFVAATTSVGYSPAALTLYSFKMYNDNDELIRDFIPVRTPGGEVGLLDKVYNKFYANDGVGTFNVGADVGTFVSVSPFLIESDLGAVAFSNNYNDLSNKPSIPSAPGRLNTTNDTAQTTSASESLAGTVNLHKVAKTGTYSDLIGTPTIPTVGELDTSNTTPNTPDTESLSGHIDLHVISKTGSYLDLLDKPTIPSAPGTLNTTVSTTIATNASESLSGDIQLHKVSKTGSYSDLLNKPTIPTVGTLNTTATTAQSTASAESLSGNIVLHQVAKTGNADKVDNYHMTTYGYNYKGSTTVFFRRKAKGTITMAERDALTPSNTVTGDIYIISDDNNNEYCAAVRSGTLSWTKLVAPYKDYPILEDNDAPIYIKIHSAETYANSFVDFYIAPMYDNCAGSTEIREYCRATNVYYANAVNYNGNKLVGIFQGKPGTAQASANTDYWYLKLTKHLGTYTAMPWTYYGYVEIYMNQNITSAELIQTSHSEYQYVSNYSYFALPNAGISTSSTTFQKINGVTVGTDPKFTDANVLQEASSTSANYNILFRADTGNTSGTNKVKFDSDGKFTYNPSSNTLSADNISATTLNGVTIGNNPKFTDTIYDLQTGTNASKGEIILFPNTGTSDKVYIQGSGLTSVSSDANGNVTVATPNEIFWCTYNVTPFSDIETAYQANKIVAIKYGGNIYLLSDYIAEGVVFVCDTADTRFYITVSAENEWGNSSYIVERASNKTTVLSSSSTNIQYPSAKATYDAIQDVREIAEGKSATYIIDDTVQTEFNSSTDPIHLIGTTFTDANSVVHNVADVRVGDMFYVTQTDVPDRWVSHVEINQTVSSLANTTWQFNNVLSSIYGNWTAVNLNFTSNGNSYTSIVGYTSGGKIHLRYGDTEVYNAETSGWLNDVYKSISITGGSNAETTNVISWMNTNAVLQGEAYNATLYILETAKVPITSVSVNGTAVTPNDGNVDISVPTTYLKSVTAVDKKAGSEVTSPSNILRITKQDNTTFDYEPNSVKFKDFSVNQEADENNKTINLNLTPYNQAGIWYTVASATIAKMANVPGNVASGECMLETRPFGSTRYSMQIFSHKSGANFAVWQRVQNNTNNWGRWCLSPVGQVTTNAGTALSTSDTDYIATVTTNGQKLYRSTKKVTDFATPNDITITGIKINGTSVSPVNKVVSFTVPYDTGDLTNGAGYVTKDVDDLTYYTKTSDLAFVSDVTLGQNGTSLVNAGVAAVPSTVSSYTNDAGYLTASTGVTSVNGSHGAITGIATTSDLGNYISKTTSTNVNSDVTTTWNTWGTRKITISGNDITLDMSAETGGWAGTFAKFKDAYATSNMLGFYGGGTNGLTRIYMGGTYSAPTFKIEKVLKSGTLSSNPVFEYQPEFPDKLKVGSLCDGFGSSAHTFTLPSTSGQLALVSQIPSTSAFVTGPSSSTDNHVAVFNGTTGKGIKDSGFTIGKSVPSNAVFTDTLNTTGTTVPSEATTLFLVGAETQADSAVTYTHTNCYIGNDGCLYSGGAKVLTSHQSLSNYVTLTGTETISGNKTFTGVEKFVGEVQMKSSAASASAANTVNGFRFKSNQDVLLAHIGTNDSRALGFYAQTLYYRPAMAANGDVDTRYGITMDSTGMYPGSNIMPLGKSTNPWGNMYTEQLSFTKNDWNYIGGVGGANSSVAIIPGNKTAAKTNAVASFVNDASGARILPGHTDNTVDLGGLTTTANDTTKYHYKDLYMKGSIKHGTVTSALPATSGTLANLEDLLAATTYTNATPTTATIGGIPKGTTFDNVPLLDIIEQLLYPYVAFSFSSISTTAASGSFEYGTTKSVTKVKPTFTLGSKNLTSVKVGTTSGGGDLYSGTTATSGSDITLTTPLSIPGTSNTTVYCTISDGTTTTTKSVTFSFAKYYYWTVTNSTTIPTTATVISGGGSQKDITTTVNTYIWFLSPVQKSKIQQFAMNQWNNVNTTYAGTTTFTTTTGQSLTYYAYRTDKMVAATGTYRLN